MMNMGLITLTNTINECLPAFNQFYINRWGNREGIELLVVISSIFNNAVCYTKLGINCLATLAQLPYLHSLSSPVMPGIIVVLPIIAYAAEKLDERRLRNLNDKHVQDDQYWKTLLRYGLNYFSWSLILAASVINSIAVVSFLSSSSLFAAVGIGSLYLFCRCYQYMDYVNVIEINREENLKKLTSS